MPVMRGTDTFGAFYRYGLRGKKYYYLVGDPASREAAKALAARQGRAEHARSKSA